MKILELEAKTGLDRATIRFYEKEGLIAPIRRENGYREYTDSDYEDLLKIKLLRQLGMSVDRIRNLQQGSEDFSSALNDQIDILEKQISTAHLAKMVCQAMLNDHVCYETLNTALYLPKLSIQPSVNSFQPNSNYHEAEALEPYHPWCRFFARYIDYTMIRILLQFAVDVILRIRTYNDFWTFVIKYGTPFIAVPILAFFLSRFGTTPGKWFLGLEVKSYTGINQSFPVALEREWNVLRYGYGFGLPIWSIYRLYKSYKTYRDDRNPMSWDDRFEYGYYCITQKKIIILIVTYGWK